ncbi:MAG: hypothetical protein WBL68_01720, partial [Nitrososphaeraceae archaeon]
LAKLIITSKIDFAITTIAISAFFIQYTSMYIKSAEKEGSYEKNPAPLIQYRLAIIFICPLS